MEILNRDLAVYLNSFYNFENGELGEIQKKAIEQRVPIIPNDTANFITLILAIKKPKSILEIGSAVGFSSSLFSNYLDTGGKIITIEKNPEMVLKAKENFDKLGLNQKIEILEGDAAEVLDGVEQKFDVIFMDAAKGQYINILDKCLNLLNNGGILIADDVLQGGTIAMDISQTDRKNRTIRRRMKSFLEEINSRADLKTAVIPVGDGVSVSYKFEL